MDVGETEVAAGIAVCQTFVIQPQEMQDGGVQIVDTDRIFLGFETELVGRTVNCSPTDPTAREPDTETIMIVIATKFAFAVAF